ncbi:MAG: glycine--tRNA ligase subunit beta [Tissierellia bacterium]|nr:glycine--tRNA ligase subunit beta [Tissierellia bacterium]
MSNYLLEIGVEEFPSDYVASTKEQLKNKFEKLLSDNKFNYESVEVESTPRRFAVFVNNVDSENEGENKKIKGPSVNIAFDDQKNPTKALNGFLKGQNMSLDDVFIEEIKDTSYVFVNKKQDNAYIKDILQNNVYDLIKSLTFPRSMRWGAKSIKFARPIRWFVSLLDDQILEFNAEGIKVSNITKGHRVLGKSEIEIKHQADYERLLEENYVILSYKKRRNIIVRGLNRLANEKGGNYLKDEDLLDEVINIVEYPTVIVGDIDNKYLKLPKEVIVTPMKDHQRYFPIVDDDSNLLAYFLTVRNGDDTAIENVANGNKRVLTARLEDAKFFYDKDNQKKLQDYVEDLKKLTFYEGLGDMYRKTERLRKLALNYLQRFGMGEDISEKVNRAAFLSKADLVTSMVIEFTELQGIMGRIYAKNSGEDELVQKAIEEHYLPKSNGDKLPKSTVGTVLSITDKLDTICGLYAIGKYVTGTKDPYGLRRNAIGIIKILIENKIDVDLKDLIKDSLFIYTDQDELSIDYDKTSKEILTFLIDRLKNLLLDDNYPYDFVNSVLDTSVTNVYDIYVRLNNLMEFSKREDFDKILNCFTRVSNIVKDAEIKSIDPTLLENDTEEKIYEFANDLEDFDKLLVLKQYKEALEKLSSFTDTINNYLDNTMINVDDENLRNNRLSMLKIINDNIKKIFIAEDIVK